MKTASKTPPVPQTEDLDTAPEPLEPEPLMASLQASGNNPHESGQ
jgi:hypothetical protein